MSKITLARYRNTDYIVRCTVGGREERYMWKGSRHNLYDKQNVPKEVVDWLNMNTDCFNNGSLVIESNDKDSEEVKGEIADVESYTNNTLKREEIEELLMGHWKRLESSLKDITVDEEKRFVLDIARELQDDLTGGKQKAIAEWYGQEVEALFE